MYITKISSVSVLLTLVVILIRVQLSRFVSFGIDSVLSEEYIGVSELKSASERKIFKDTSGTYPVGRAAALIGLYT